MIKYICPKCNEKSELSECPFCEGKVRTEICDNDLFWCAECNIPTFGRVCGICGNSNKRIASDLRPVFPEERLLIEAVLGEPMKYHGASVWCTPGSIYYANGVKIPFTISQAAKSDPSVIRNIIKEYEEQNTYNYFDNMIARFVSANKSRYEYITSEAMDYVRSQAEKYDKTEMYVSFSGGKDSTVVSDLVLRALGTNEILHIYGDTTLEFPESKLYLERFKKAHKGTLIITAKNKDKDFDTLCEQLGPPSRVMRWCCTVFKTGAIQRKLQATFKNTKKVLTFYGIRRNESNSRSKYDRASDSPKITKQKTVSPIIDWFDFDIWLYILTTGIDFNNSYRKGYTRVGCWCCPNNSSWSETLSKVYMPEQYEHFRNMLVEFATKIGKPDAEEYVDTGKWKARQGGNGVEYAQTSVLTVEPCALQEDTLNFELQRPISEELYEMFKPFGYVNKSIGNERLGEVYITDINGKFLLKLQGKIGATSLKVSIIDKKAGHCKGISEVENKIKCQITKYQMCMGCLACESVCMFGAVDIDTDKSGLKSYRIIDDKCRRCGECINHFNGGCYMRKVMTIKRS